MPRKAQPQPRRTWIKLWCENWLTGSTRFELTPEQRAIWVDLLALAGRSRWPGIVAANLDGPSPRGYPLRWLAGICMVELDAIEAAMDVFIASGKVTSERDAAGGYIIRLTAWEKYQSEYQRQKPYRTAAKARQVTSEVTAKLLGDTEPDTEPESEGDSETERQEGLANEPLSLRASWPEEAETLRGMVRTFEEKPWAMMMDALAEQYPMLNVVKELRALKSWLAGQGKLPLTGTVAPRRQVRNWFKKGEEIAASRPAAATSARATEPPVPLDKCWQEGCSGSLVPKKGQKGAFVGCTAYPRCKFTMEPIDWAEMPYRGQRGDGGTGAEAAGSRRARIGRFEDAYKAAYPEAAA